MRSPLNWMLVLVPVAVALEWSHANPPYVFIASAAAIIPLAILGMAFYTLPN